MDALQLVAEPSRQAILRHVWQEELPVGELVDRLDLSYAGVSQHLGLLREAGFVTVRREGKRRFYRADLDRLGPLKDLLESFWAAQLDRLTILAEEIERRSATSSSHAASRPRPPQSSPSSWTASAGRPGRASTARSSRGRAAS
jgi:DNA-binding transcriptional ArsR family regulator